MKKKSRIGLIRGVVQRGMLGLFLVAACDTVRPVTPTPIDPGQQLPTPAISPQIEAVTVTPSSNQQDNGAPTVVVEEQDEVPSPTPPGGDGHITAATPQTPVAITVTTTRTMTPTQDLEPSTTMTTPSPTATAP